MAAGSIDRGAYGFRIDAQLPPDCLAVRNAVDWPRLSVAFQAQPRARAGELTHPAPGGVACLSPSTGQARVPLNGETNEDCLHPGLAIVGFLAARSRDEEAIHGGAFAHRGGAWVILGDHEQGKSTLLVLLARSGAEVLADDLTVIREGQVCAGPRVLDLRPPAAKYFGLGAYARGGMRRRLSLDPVEAEHPLRGFLHLTWSAEVEIRLLAPRIRLQRLVAQIGHLPRRQPRRLLELAALPHYELARPRDWQHAQRGVDLVLAITTPALDSAWT